MWVGHAAALLDVLQRLSWLRICQQLLHEGLACSANQGLLQTHTQPFERNDSELSWLLYSQAPAVCMHAEGKASLPSWADRLAGSESRCKLMHPVVGQQGCKSRVCVHAIGRHFVWVQSPPDLLLGQHTGCCPQGPACWTALPIELAGSLSSRQAVSSRPLCWLAAARHCQALPGTARRLSAAGLSLSHTLLGCCLPSQLPHHSC